jgi:mannan endo-1,4-beta-mannosidase
VTYLKIGSGLEAPKNRYIYLSPSSLKYLDYLIKNQKNYLGTELLLSSIHTFNMKSSMSVAVSSLGLFAFASASNSFAGSSLYFLPGLSSSDQAYYIDTLASYGAKVIRIWINGLGTGCVKGSNVVTSVQEFETTIGNYNYDSLAAVDAVLAQMAAKGMKAIISPHDGNDIHDSSVSGNGCDIYCETYGTSFYSNSDAHVQYDARIKAILTYKSPSSGLTWGNWSDAILAFDIENEPFQFTDDGANNDPSGWLCGRAANFKNYIEDSNIKVATGGIGGDQSHNYNMLPAALACPSIDLMSVHAYVGDASTWGSIMPGFESSSASNNKLVYVEEWGVSTSYNSDFNSQSSAINQIGYPWVCRNP